MHFIVAIRAESDGILDDIWRLFRQEDYMMHNEVWFSIIRNKRGWFFT